ncbi:MAG: glycerol-3-phosphate acyltransferase [Clostridiales bacterium]|jgi:glycerol-3-phosphate acyltransferase PlsY|nr:glycerol-3-phosphate acyltransferase [Clostridiales bacterium]
MVLLAAGYLFGCVNSSIILTTLLEKKDVRDFGSGNAGFTNTLRNFRLRTAILVFAGDALKAAAALTLAVVFAKGNSLALFGAGVGVILGHNFPFVHKFKGGKGVLVSCVALFFADWRMGIAVLLLAVAVMLITGYVSLGSLTGAVLLPVLTVALHRGDMLFLAFSLVVAGLSVYTHRENIKRLRGGTEHRFRKRSESK